MNQFIADYPGVIYLIGAGLIIAVVYFYKKAAKAEQSVIMVEISKAVKAIEHMAEEISTLFKKDSHRRNEVQELSERLGKQEAKCREREKLWHERTGNHSRDADDHSRPHCRQGEESESTC
jgi:hypothetical protein